MSAKIVKFIPIKHGDKVEIGDSNKLVGFKPGRAGKHEPRRKMK
jgi:hypothetical protein